MLNALIFDVDGTLADTEQLHLDAFNRAFTEVGLGWRWDLPLYIRLLAVAGGKERIKAYRQGRMGQVRVAEPVSDHDVERIHKLKTIAYERAMRQGEGQLRPGVMSLLAEAKESGLKLAIATTTTPSNVVALLDSTVGPEWGRYFTVIEDASTAPRKKPDPVIYHQVLERLGLPAENCLAFEDSENGLRAATGAGVATIVTPNAFTADHNFQGALRVVPDLEGITVAHLRQWHAEVSQEVT